MKERKKVKEYVEVPLPQFFKMLSKTRMCNASWVSKSGYTAVFAERPAVCWASNGSLTISGKAGLYVTFMLPSISSVSLENSDNFDEYIIAIKDGTALHLTFLH